MRSQRRGESALEALGGIVVFFLVIGALIWFFTGKNPVKSLASGENPLVPSIVGRWDVVRSGTNRDVAGYMRFNQDGTFTSTLLFLATTDGKYKLLSNSVVELDFPGVIYGRNKLECQYTLDNHSLTLNASNNLIDLAFKRVD